MPRVAEPRGDLGCVRTDWLHDLASVGEDRVGGRGDILDHDVEEQTRLRGRCPPEYPCAAHFAGRVVEGAMTLAALPDPPTRSFLGLPFRSHVLPEVEAVVEKHDH